MRNHYNVRLMSEANLPKQVDPYALANSKSVITGQLKNITLERVSAAGGQICEPISVTLCFSYDEHKRPFISGEVHTRLMLQCQRCLETLTTDVNCELALLVVRDEQEAKQIPAQYEPVIIAGKTIPVFELIEDEIILGLPMFAKHDDSCGTNFNVTPEESVTEPVRNPFQVLRNINE